MMVIGMAIPKALAVEVATVFFAIFHLYTDAVSL